MPPDNSEYFFQSASTQSNFARKASKADSKAGDPIRLGAKLNAVLVDPRSGDGGRGCKTGQTGGGEDLTDAAVFVADSTGVAKRVDIETGKPTHTYLGSCAPERKSAPLTSLAVYQSSAKPLRLFATSWDSTIYSWSATSTEPLRRYTDGHTDFVKCIACSRLSKQSHSAARDTSRTTHSADDAGEAEDDGGILISGGADARVIVWNIASGEKFHLLRAHSRGVLDVAVEPPLTPHSQYADAGTAAPQEAITVYSASSSREIRRWEVTRETVASVAFPAAGQGLEKGDAGTSATAQEGSEEGSLTPHETSINSLRFTSLGTLFPSFSPQELCSLVGFGTERYTEEEESAVALLTASSDNTGKCVILPRSSDNDKLNSEEATSRPRTLFTLPHPDFVRDILIVPASSSHTEPLVVTGCRDENIRIWSVPEDPSNLGGGISAASGIKKSAREEEMKPLAVLEGHYEEVTGLSVVYAATDGCPVLVSVSLDGTIRRWGLSHEHVMKASTAASDEEGDDDDDAQDETDKGDRKSEAQLGGHTSREAKTQGEKEGVKLTEEEERELEELNDLMHDD